MDQEYGVGVVVSINQRTLALKTPVGFGKIYLVSIEREIND